MNKVYVFSVRCLFEHPTRKSDAESFLFEERINIWFASDIKEAYAMAEAEALNYAKEAKATFIRATDGFRLFDENLSSGVEVWAVMRGSNLSPEVYEETFINTSRDRKSID